MDEPELLKAQEAGMRVLIVALLLALLPRMSRADGELRTLVQAVQVVTIQSDTLYLYMTWNPAWLAKSKTRAFPEYLDSVLARKDSIRVFRHVLQIPSLTPRRIVAVGPVEKLVPTTIRSVRPVESEFNNYDGESGLPVVDAAVANLLLTGKPDYVCETSTETTVGYWFSYSSVPKQVLDCLCANMGQYVYRTEQLTNARVFRIDFSSD
jgi:hypothetical protein